jgi:hypothetical protein
MRDHLTFEQIVELAERGAALDEQARKHIAGCSVCAGELARVERLITLMRTSHIESPPDQAAARVRTLFRDHRRKAGRPRIDATLSFNSARAPLAAGLRTGSTVERQLVFAAGAFLIDLHITLAQDQWIVAGQILDPEANGMVELTGPTISVRADISDLSEFRRPAVPAGRYTLAFQLADLDIAIPDLELEI